MNKLLIGSMLALAACQTMPDPESMDTVFRRAVAAESALVARCTIGPPSVSEWQIVTTARLLFMSAYGPRLSDEQRRTYDLTIGRSNEACGSSF